MRSFIQLSAASVAFANADLVELQWNEFKQKFNRQYESEEEETTRKQHFIDNLKRLEKLNEQDDNWIPSGHLSPLADWSAAEFNGRNTLKSQLASKPLNTQPDDSTKELKELKDEDSWDWRQKGAVNKVKNQGQCGSCWSFSTIANIEGVYAAKSGKLLSLSEQQMVDCDKSDHGCNGGLPELADKWLIAHHYGLETEERYPYTGVPQVCAQDPSRERIFVGKFLQISQDEDMIAHALMQHGPLSIGINANTMQMYMGGIANPSREACDPQMLNHGVALVGFGAEDTPEHPQDVKKLIQEHRNMKTQSLIQNMPVMKEGGASTKFWIIRNSWGEVWGEEGYYRILRGKGACGMNLMVTTAEEITYKPPGAGEEPKFMEQKQVQQEKAEFYI